MTFQHLQTLTVEPYLSLSGGDPLQIVADIEEDIMKHLDLNIGFLHRGIEKIIENKTYLQALVFLSRLDYSCSMVQSHAFILAIEKLGRIEVPQRAQYLRVLFSELSRISNHLHYISSLSDVLGHSTPAHWAQIEQEKILFLFSLLCGQRMPSLYFRPGGVESDISSELVNAISSFCKEFPKALDTVEELITENNIFKKRTVFVGIVSKDDAYEWGFSGPNLRASGIPWDLRKSQPYEIYDQLEFQIPVGTHGDCYDRYCVRIAEIKQSLSLIKQCLEKLPNDGIMTDNKKIACPSREDIKESTEAMIDHCKTYTEGFQVPLGEVYSTIEAPKGELGCFLVADGTHKPYRCKVRAPSFPTLQALNWIAPGHPLSDLSVIVCSFDISISEIDR